MKTRLARLIAAAIAASSLLVAWGTASAAPYVLVAVHSRSAPTGNHAAQFFKSGTAQGCPASGPFKQPCYNPNNAWVQTIPNLITDVQASPATWDWNGTTMTGTGTFFLTAFNGSNANGTSVLGFRATNVSITPSTATATASTFECFEGTFLATVNVNGCSNVDLGLNGTLDSPIAAFNVGGNANCIAWTLNSIGGGDDSSLGGPRAVSAAAASGGCAGVVGTYDLPFVVANPRFLILSKQPAVVGFDGCYMFGRASEKAASTCLPDPALADASYYVFAPQVDTDGDTVIDALDNCRLVANTNQADSNGDGYGNRCDGDLNNNGSTNAQDTVLFRAQLGQPSVAPTYNAADINANGAVNAQDTTLYRGLLGGAPGPSGICLNTYPCPANP
ncbi:MAG: thrombospondin type 3 repeat-containing protein [Gammaproteobacteria bacterium]|nr:thrombospondin type 3 repeat-containing protein [Gammaproteobacteria bacterium]